MNQVEIKLQTLAARRPIKKIVDKKRDNMVPVLKPVGKVRQVVKNNNYGRAANNDTLDKDMAAINMKNVTSDTDLKNDDLNKYQPKGKKISWPEAHKKLLKMGYQHEQNVISNRVVKTAPFVSIYKHPSFGKDFRLGVFHNENGVMEAHHYLY